MHLTCYLAVCSNHTIIYPIELYRTTTYDICKEVYPGNFHPKNITKGLVDLKFGGEGRVPNEKRAIACIVLCLFGVAVHC